MKYPKTYPAEKFGLKVKKLKKSQLLSVYNIFTGKGKFLSRHLVPTIYIVIYI